MRLATLLLMFVVVHVHSDPTKRQRAKIFMTNVDLDTNRKRNVDPEVALDVKPPTTKSVTTTTKLPDYGDYEDYELTEKTAEVTTTTLSASLVPTKTSSSKSSEEIRDELSRLMGDLHREELSLTETTSTTTEDPMAANMSMFFGDDIEGSAEMEDVLNLTETSTAGLQRAGTTLLQEVDALPITAKPDPFEHLDYDLTNHSNTKKPKTVTKVDRLKKYKTVTLHGGAVEKPTKTSPTSTTISPTLRKSKDRRKYLRKLTKLDRLKKVKYLNQRPRAHNRMRLRKVLQQLNLKRVMTTTSTQSPKPRFKIVGSEGVVTPVPFELNQIDSKTKRSRREKREVQNFDSAEDDDDEWDTVPIETGIIESIPYEPHPAYHLVAQNEKKRTQVEPSPLIAETDEEEDAEDDTVPMKRGLVQVKLQKNPLKMKPRVVTLDSDSYQETTEGVSSALPKAKKPTMLDQLIRDFLTRLPPTARPNYLSQDQWS